jgi:hypothetical protein
MVTWLIPDKKLEKFVVARVFGADVGCPKTLGMALLP